jgi:RNA polymerase sigma-70 factor, ECF subfamily
LKKMEVQVIARAIGAKRTDKELMILIAKGEMESLGDLYVRYGGAVRSLIWRLLPAESAIEAEDLCHEVFEIVYKNAARFQVDRDLRPWLFGIAAKHARAWQRKKWARNKLLRRFVGERSALVTSAIKPMDSSGVTRGQIQQVMMTLPVTQREVLVLYVLSGMKGEQIAEALGVNLNTVWTRLRRARIAMRTILGDLCDDIAFGEER